MSLLTNIKIDLTDRPRFGRTQILVRCQAADKELVDRVAKAVGMTVSDFVRTVVIKCARKLEQEIQESKDGKSKDDERMDRKQAS